MRSMLTIISSFVLLLAIQAMASAIQPPIAETVSDLPDQPTLTTQPNPKEGKTTHVDDDKLDLIRRRMAEELDSLQQGIAEQKMVLEQAYHDLLTPKLPADELRLIAEVDQLQQTLERSPVVADAPIMIQLMSRRIDLMIDIAGLTARQESVQQDSSKQQAAAREVLLEKIKMQQQIYEIATTKRDHIKLLYESGTALASKLSSIEQDVANQRIKYLELKQQLQAVPEGDLALGQTTLQLAEKRAQLQMVNQLLSEAAAARPIQAELEKLQSRLARVRNTRESGISDAIRQVETRYQELNFRRIGVEDWLKKNEKQNEKDDQK